MEWEKINTSLDSILECNKISKDKQRMFWVLMGRALLQSPNDNWQVELFLLGDKKPRDAIIDYIKTYLSLTKEEKITILNKMGIFLKGIILKQNFPLYIIENPEDDTTFPLSPMEFCRMVGNEIISMPVKYKPPLQVKWKKRGIYSSNKYDDTKHSFSYIKRRMGSIEFTLDFNENNAIPLLQKYAIPLLQKYVISDITSIIYNYYKVYDIDEKTIASESKNFYLKATTAYLETSKTSGNMNFHRLFT